MEPRPEAMAIPNLPLKHWTGLSSLWTPEGTADPKWMCGITQRRVRQLTRIIVMENYLEGEDIDDSTKERLTRPPCLRTVTMVTSSLGMSNRHEKGKQLPVFGFGTKIPLKSVPWRRHTWNRSRYKKWPKQASEEGRKFELELFHSPRSKSYGRNQRIGSKSKTQVFRKRNLKSSVSLPRAQTWTLKTDTATSDLPGPRRGREGRYQNLPFPGMW